MVVFLVSKYRASGNRPDSGISGKNVGVCDAGLQIMHRQSAYKVNLEMQDRALANVAAKGELEATCGLIESLLPWDAVGRLRAINHLR